MGDKAKYCCIIYEVRQMALRLTRIQREKDKAGKVLVVFIHGLGATEKTWISEKTDWMKLILSDKRFLNTDVAVIKYGTSHVALGKLTSVYNRLATRFKKQQFSRVTIGEGPFANIKKLAQELKRELNMENIKNYEQILFVCHSMGGLVGIRYILEELERDTPIKVVGFISLATPYNGSNKAVYHGLIKHIHNHSQIPQLEPNSSFTDDTMRLWQKNKSKMALSCVFCYGTEDKWVTEESSIPHIIDDKWADSIPLPGNHSSILDVENHKSLPYEVISERILNIIIKNNGPTRINPGEPTSISRPPKIETSSENFSPLPFSNESEIKSEYNRLICLLDLAYFGLSIHSRLGWLFSQFAVFDESIRDFKRLVNDLKSIVLMVQKSEKRTELIRKLEDLSLYVLPFVMGEEDRPNGWKPANDLAKSIQDDIETLEYKLMGEELAAFKLGQYLGKWDNNEAVSEDKLSLYSEQLIIRLIEQLSINKEVPEEILQIFKEYRLSDSISNIHIPHRIYNKVRTMLILNLAVK
ncbi:hypothetical protein FZC78_06480 [Rossellomorea vietnamensis]|uniref:DUF676 domain-containing protein n=1 Tax=Rossellomorea vietnamensis TaxID=218284 RepID=A0A5D4NUB0_9BACI|nr:hypothetical protein [Rossellomorea vietnamensis]TYS17520.1 hypothetical protein FZC78_06480 [Rossellomorea vietnamensis]